MMRKDIERIKAFVRWFEEHGEMYAAIAFTFLSVSLFLCIPYIDNPGRSFWGAYLCGVLTLALFLGAIAGVAFIIELLAKAKEKLHNWAHSETK